MQLEQLVALHPTLFHMAEAGTWPSIQEHGLLSTKAIVDMCQPSIDTADEILGAVRRRSIIVEHPQHGQFVIRDQQPLKFLDQCLQEDTTPAQFLDALNSRVFFWVTHERLTRLLKARLYRCREHIVLYVDTKSLLTTYEGVAQLAPYNTGSMHVPTAPRRGVDVFAPIAAYPYEFWRQKRRNSDEAIVELTLPYAVPDIARFTSRVEIWNGGHATKTLYMR